jgi:hypothetical protein
MGQMEVFTNYYENNSWGKEESKSGPGSSVSYTYNVRRGIEEFCTKWKINTFFDAPCGDFNWMRLVEFPPGTNYIGADVVRPMITCLSELNASPSRKFMEVDITKDPLPDADVWFCRDCLFHLCYSDILAALENFCRSNITYLFASCNVNTRRMPFENRDTYTGDCRPLDLFSAPFELDPKTQYFCVDYVSGFSPREMHVWNRFQVDDALPRIRNAIGG